MNEQQYVTNIIKAINDLGGKAVKFVETEYSEKGTPDIIGSYKGRAFAIEAKVDDNKVSIIQEIRLQEWFDAGAIAIGVWQQFASPEDIAHWIKGVVERNWKFRDLLDMRNSCDENCK